MHLIHISKKSESILYIKLQIIIPTMFMFVFSHHPLLYIYIFLIPIKLKIDYFLYFFLILVFSSTQRNMDNYFEPCSMPYLLLLMFVSVCFHTNSVHKIHIFTLKTVLFMTCLPTCFLMMLTSYFF